jgi:hypothetical protein
MRLASLSLIASLLILPVAAKATNFTDGFPTATQGLGVTAAGNFHTINGTNVDVLGPISGYGNLCAGVTVCVDLGGSGGDPYGQLVSNTTFGPGTYYSTFTISGSQRGIDTTFDVSFGSVVDQAIFVPSGQGALTYSDTITVTSPTVFEFDLPMTGTTNGNVGPILDSATVTQIGATPEPSSLVLLGSGLLSGAGALLRRRKR